MDKIKLLSKQEINKFTTLIKNDFSAKLNAEEVIHLNPHIYHDYLQKIKYYAGLPKQNATHNHQHEHNTIKRSKYSSKLSFKKDNNRPIYSMPSSQSYYYTKRTQILSMKEFIILLQQSKKQRQRQDRIQHRKKQKQFIQYVGRTIQSSHSQRNLRLTSSSANRIIKRINRINNEKLYE